MLIRDAENKDIPGITEIYNDAVLNTTAIWTGSVVDAAGREAWFAACKKAGYPFLVADDGWGTIMGYATFGDWRAKDGYRHTVEHSVYVRGANRGGGIGRALMEALIPRARQLGKHVMIAGIEAENRASIALHRKLGFVEVGVAREVGVKFGKWLDLAFWQLTLDARSAPGDF